MISNTSPSACFAQLAEGKDDEDEVIEFCFNPHTVNSCLLTYYIMTHVLFYVFFLISNCGLAKDSINSNKSIPEQEVDTNKSIPEQEVDTNQSIPEQKVDDSAKFYEQQPQNYYEQFY